MRVGPWIHIHLCRFLLIYIPANMTYDAKAWIQVTRRRCIGSIDQQIAVDGREPDARAGTYVQSGHR